MGRLLMDIIVILVSARAKQDIQVLHTPNGYDLLTFLQEWPHFAKQNALQ